MQRFPAWLEREGRKNEQYRFYKAPSGSFFTWTAMAASRRQSADRKVRALQEASAGKHVQSGRSIHQPASSGYWKDRKKATCCAAWKRRRKRRNLHACSTKAERDRGAAIRAAQEQTAFRSAVLRFRNQWTHSLAAISAQKKIPEFLMAMTAAAGRMESHTVCFSPSSSRSSKREAKAACQRQQGVHQKL